MFVSTHLISEFEGLIDEFTIIDHGRDVLTMEADTARERYQKIYARFPTSAAGARSARLPRAARSGREIEVIVDGITGQRGRHHRALEGAVAGDAHHRGALARRDLRGHTSTRTASGPVSAVA